ncbi:unnamed protein product, partial [Ascophyllum nodosum]
MTRLSRGRLVVGVVLLPTAQPLSGGIMEMLKKKRGNMRRK